MVQSDLLRASDPGPTWPGSQLGSPPAADLRMGTPLDQYHMLPPSNTFQGRRSANWSLDTSLSSTMPEVANEQLLHPSQGVSRNREWNKLSEATPVAQHHGEQSMFHHPANVLDLRPPVLQMNSYPVPPPPPQAALFPSSPMTPRVLLRPFGCPPMIPEAPLDLAPPASQVFWPLVPGHHRFLPPPTYPVAPCAIPGEIRPPLAQIRAPRPGPPPTLPPISQIISDPSPDHPYITLPPLRTRHSASLTTRLNAADTIDEGYVEGSTRSALSLINAPPTTTTYDPSWERMRIWEAGERPRGSHFPLEPRQPNMHDGMQDPMNQALMRLWHACKV